MTYTEKKMACSIEHTVTENAVLNQTIAQLIEIILSQCYSKIH